MTTLQTDRAAAQTRFEQAQRAAGAARLAGETPDLAAIESARGEILAIDLALSEADRLEAEARPVQAAELYRERLAELEGHEERRLAALARAEVAARQCVGALAEVFAESASMQPLFRQLQETAGMNAMAGSAIEAVALTRRISESLAAVLKQLVPGDFLGSLNLGSASHAHVSGQDDWVARERAAVGGEIAALKRKVPEA